MSTPPSARARVRPAGRDDADAIGRLLHDFNREFDAPTPEPGVLAERMRRLLATRETAVLLAAAAGERPDGFVVLRFRDAIWSAGLECYVAELYVVPARRGEGLGRALMEEAIELARRRGADTIDLGTSDDDVAARALYERLGFSNRDGGAVNYFYEREL